MANLYNVVLSVGSERLVQVVADSPEQAQEKVVPNEGETVKSVEDRGAVTV